MEDSADKSEFQLDIKSLFTAKLGVTAEKITERRVSKHHGGGLSRNIELFLLYRKVRCLCWNCWSGITCWTTLTASANKVPQEAVAARGTEGVGRPRWAWSPGIPSSRVLWVMFGKKWTPSTSWRRKVPPPL